MGKIFNRILRTLTLLPFRDTQCGFKAFRREAAREIFARQTIDGFAFDVEVILLAQVLGYRIGEPVSYTHLDVYKRQGRVRRRIFAAEDSSQR